MNELRQERNKLYSAKERILKEMEQDLETIKKRGSNPTKEEDLKFKDQETQLDLIHKSLKEIDDKAHEAAEKVARMGTRDGNGLEIQQHGDSFSSPAGIEIPVYNRFNKRSLHQDYLDTNNVSDDLKGMTFGRLVRAKLFGHRDAMEQRALSEGTPSAGGYTVPDIVSAQLIDRMRPLSRVLQAGANLFTIGQKTDKFNIAKLESGPTIQWLAENAESTPSDMTFGNVQFAFKTVRSIIRLSNELLQDSLNLEKAIELESAKGFAGEFDRVALVGNGTTEPRGIINYSDHETVTIGANGAAPTDFDEIIALIMELQMNNANIDGSTPAIMSPRTLAAYNVLKDSVNGQPLQRPPYIQSMPFLHSTNVPITDTQGSSSVASKLFLGDWSQLYLGQRLGISVIPLNQRYAEFNQTAFMIVARIDIQPYHEAAFGYIKGLLGATLPT